jgi:hypothetical protein
MVGDGKKRGPSLKPNTSEMRTRAAMKRLHADFNNFDANGILPLNRRGSLDSIAALSEPLQDGELVWLSDGELEVIARVSLAKDGVWEARSREWTFRGLEFDWLGCDEVGCVGLFSTAGAGYPPIAFMLDKEAHERAIEAILALPPSTTASSAPPVGEGLTNTWKLVAERGLFAYDSDPNGGPYRLVATPAVPIRMAALPVDIADVVARIKLALRFEDKAEVTNDLVRARDMP